VILAGFGAFGTIVGRFLVANGVRTTILDTDPDHVDLLRRLGIKVFYGDASREEMLRAAGAAEARVLNGLRMRATVIDRDPNQIELVRRFGTKAYYGDASRLDVLEQAGLAQARLLVVALDDYEASLRLVREVRGRYPALKLIARAHSRSDAFEYAELGVPAVRETFGSALDAAEAALRALDFGPMAARRVVTRFRRHDEETLAEQAPHRGETKKLIALQQRGRKDLERLLAVESLGAAPAPAAARPTGSSAG